MKRKSQRGMVLIEVLIAVIIFGFILAAMALSLVAVTQQQNETNAKLGVASIMKAEAAYAGANSNAYATGTNLHYLSDCGAKVDAQHACLLSPAFTNGVTYDGFDYSVAASGAGYVAIAEPHAAGLGRMTYCGGVGTNPDGQVRFKIGLATPASADDCVANYQPVVDVGATPAPASTPTSYTHTSPFWENTDKWNNDNWTVASGLNLPSGSYLVTATSTIVLDNTGMSIICYLSDSAGSLTSQPTVVSSGYSTGSATGYPLSINGVVTSPSTDTLNLICKASGGFKWQNSGDFVFSATPIQLPGTQNWGVGPTTFTAVQVTNTSQ